MASFRDTSVDAEQFRTRFLQSLTGTERAQMAVDMTKTAQEISRQGIAARHPNYTPEQIQMAFVRLILKKFVDLCLADGYYVSELPALGTISEGRRQFNVISGTSGWKADLMWLHDRPFSNSEFSRRTVISILGINVPVPTPEDIVLAKLEWGGSIESRQFDDLVSVIRVTDQAFDLVYTRHWAAELGVSELLEAAIACAHQ